MAVSVGDPLTICWRSVGELLASCWRAVKALEGYSSKRPAPVCIGSPRQVLHSPAPCAPPLLLDHLRSSISTCSFQFSTYQLISGNTSAPIILSLLVISNSNISHSILPLITRMYIVLYTSPFTNNPGRVVRELKPHLLDHPVDVVRG